MKEKSETKDLAMTPKEQKWICVDGVGSIGENL
jgi:hypothetical protein